jgi:hypothetical protein
LAGNGRAAGRLVGSLLLSGIAAFVLIPEADAGDVMSHCSPTVIDAPNGLDWAITGVTQASDDSDADPDLTGSFDSVGHFRQGPGFWMAQVEGSSGQNSGRVSGQFPLSNGDAATAVDEDGDGRLQLSQFNYTVETGEFAYAFGYLDPTCYLDQSNIMGDESLLFLAEPFVNNLSVSYPDYTLGGGIHFHRDSGVEATLFLSGSNGLGDNDSASYSNLLDVTDSGKGVFAAAEILLGTAVAYRLGIWTNTRDFEQLDDPGDDGSAYGVYAAAERDSDELGWNVRIGASNPEVSEISAFAAVALQAPWRGRTVGLGVSYLRASGDLDSKSSNSIFAEALLHLDFGDNLRLTPLLQWTRNDSFTARDAFIVGLRGTYFRVH